MVAFSRITLAFAIAGLSTAQSFPGAAPSGDLPTAAFPSGAARPTGGFDAVLRKESARDHNIVARGVVVVKLFAVQCTWSRLPTGTCGSAAQPPATPHDRSLASECALRSFQSLPLIRSPSLHRLTETLAADEFSTSTAAYDTPYDPIEIACTITSFELVKMRSALPCATPSLTHSTSRLVHTIAYAGPLPSTFLESFVPGYGIISDVILRLFGVDIGLLASGCVVIFGLSHAASFCNSYLHSYFDRYFTSSVTIDGDDELYGNVVSWITQQRMTRISRDLRAQTKTRNAYHDSEGDSDDEDSESAGNAIFNYGKWASNVPPRYEPNYGIDKFAHGSRRFTLSRERKDRKNSWWGDQYDEFLTLRCVGRSTQPIKDLLVYIKQWTLRNEDQTTSIYRPLPKNENSSDTGWGRQSNRASRPMRTVSLDRDQKKLIVSDINEYLQPETRRWYDARGIPYRRGYLFHGPPGTGKTSLSFALAGIFGLHIYCISLSEVGLTEADLNKLFTGLPRRCIVLLEDIDSAGLRRDDEPLPTEPASPTTPSAAKTSASDSPGPRRSLISLAGLLNVIDGVASHEGRVLIMTTNHPEQLDEALTRPGRVDVRICFTLATHTQIKDIFMRMYGTDAKKAKKAERTKLVSIAKSRDGSNVDDEEDEDMVEELLFKKPVLQTLSKDTLKQMAQDFADKLPEDRFSPAAIQGYLLTRKREPQRALSEACMWRDEQLKIMDEKKCIAIRRPNSTEDVIRPPKQLDEAVRDRQTLV
ncbi:hypothetical protein OPT61_g7735 [Boeremia exigua]|uniref:Uncharacterized protein n=1 Tax=Boeremia exigua TaxID=749465 RepID=A0ACC2I119_9PLEO|nr:hypothetical protein OPT61_g7735 [Boeremia exigua]